MNSLSRVTLPGGILITCFVLVGLRLHWQGTHLLQQGDEAMVQKNEQAAILHWQRAARCYYPLAHHVETALEKMRSLALAKQKEGTAFGKKQSIAIWRSIRGTVLSLRWLKYPYKDYLYQAENYLEEAGALQKRADYPFPHRGWAIVALGGFAAMIGLPWWFLGRTPQKASANVESYRSLLWPLSAFCIGLLVWLWGLWMA